VGCQLTYHVKNDNILFVEGRDGPANHARLCVKGRYGFDYARHPQRLTVPLIRRAVRQARRLRHGPEKRHANIPRGTWDEALALAGGGLRNLRDTHGPKSLAGFGSAKGATKKHICFKSWCASASAATTSTIARACATRRAWRRLLEGLVRARSAIR